MKKIVATAMVALCGVFCACAAGFDGMNLVTNDWFDANFTTSLAVDTPIATNTTTGITLGAGTWTEAPTNGTATIVADADAGGGATCLSLNAPGELLKFTPASFSVTSGMETVVAEFKADAIDELPELPGNVQGAFTVYIDANDVLSAKGWTSTGWTTLSSASAPVDSLTNQWVTAYLDFATVNDVRYVRYSVKPAAGALSVLSDVNGTSWFQARTNAATVSAVALSGVANCRTISGDSLADAVASYNGVNYETMSDAIAAAVADSWANGNVTLLADATWKPSATGTYNIDDNGHTLTLDNVRSYAHNGNVYSITKLIVVFSEDFESNDPFASGWTWNGSAHEQAERTLIDGTTTSKFLHITATRYEKGTYSFNSLCTSLADYKLEFDWFANMGYNAKTCRLQVYAGANELVHIANPNAASSQNTTAYLYVDGADYNDKTKAVATFTTAGRGGDCTGTSNQSKWYHITITAYTAKGVFLKIESQDSSVGVVYEGRIADFVNVTKLSFSADSSGYDTRGGIDDIVFSSIDVNGDDFVWTGAANDGGLWATPGNWTVGGNVATRCPGFADTATIGADATVAVDGGAVLSTIAIDPTSKLSVDASSLTKSSYSSITTNVLVYAPGIAASNVEITSGYVAEYDFDESGVIYAVIWPKTTLFWSGNGSDALWSNASNWEYGEGTAAENVPAGNNTVVFPSGFTGGVEVEFGGNTTADGVYLIIDSDVSFDSNSSTRRLVYPKSISGTGTLSLGNIQLYTVTYGTATISCNIEIASPTTSFYLRGSKSGITVSGAVSGSGALSLDGDSNNGKNYVFTGSFADFTGTLTVPNNSNITFNFNGNDDTIDFADAMVTVNGAMKLGGSYPGNTLKIGRLTGSGTINNATSNAMTLQVGLNGTDASSSATFAGTGTWTVEKVGTNRQTLTDAMVAYNATLTGGELCIPTGKELGAVSVGSGKFAFDLVADSWLDGEAHTLFSCASGVDAGTLTTANVALDLSGYTKSIYATYDNTTANQLSVTLAESSFTWVGESVGSWSDVANWQMNGAAAAEVPRNGNTVTIDGATVMASLAEDLTGVALQNGAKIALPFTDSALTATLPSNLEISDIVALGPYTITAEDGTITAARTASTFTWAGTSSAWDATANWTVNNLPTAVLPNANDTVVFPSAASEWSVTVPVGEVAVNKLTANGAVAFSGGVIRATEADGSAIITLGDDAGISAYDVAKSTLTISAPIKVTASEGHTAKVYGQMVSNATSNGSTVDFSGNLTGNGYIEFKGYRQVATMTGDWREFTGHISIPTDGIDRNSVRLSGENTYSAKAYWTVQNNDALVWNNSKTYKFGSMDGTLRAGSASATYITYEIGALNKEEMVITNAACSWADTRCERGAGFAKVGTGTLKIAGKWVRLYEVLQGTLEIDSDAALFTANGHSNGSDYPTPISFMTRAEDGLTGGVLKLGSAVTLDVSTNLVNSTAPICFSNAVNEVHTWSAALASSNTGGLVKLGEGMLTLTAEPLYTGDTYLDGGVLKIPASANKTVKTHVPGMGVYKSSETIDKVVYTVYKLGWGPMVILY